MELISQEEAVQEVHRQVRELFTKHRFVFFGDAIEWWHTTEFEDKESAAGSQGISDFSRDIMWLTSLFGPQAKIDHAIFDIRNASKTPKPPNLPKKSINNRRKKRF